MRIGIDLMGESAPLHQLINAISQHELNHQEISGRIDYFLYVYSDTLIANPLNVDHSPHIVICPCDDVVTMEDDPVSAYKTKKGSTLFRALSDLKQGNLDALISMGNTGALLCGAALDLPKFSGVKRPALLANIPTARGCTSIIDVGGSAQTKHSLMSQFALMGSAYHHLRYQRQLPAVGLLNMGVESGKGTSLHREVYASLSENAENGLYSFFGNVEARDVFRGVVDIIVCDGFSGNVLLKALEGACLHLLGYMPAESYSRLAAFFDYQNHPGALVCGVHQLLMKCHGNASAKELMCTVDEVFSLNVMRLIPQMQNLLARL